MIESNVSVQYSPSSGFYSEYLYLSVVWIFLKLLTAAGTSKMIEFFLPRIGPVWRLPNFYRLVPRMAVCPNNGCRSQQFVPRFGISDIHNRIKFSAGTHQQNQNDEYSISNNKAQLARVRLQLGLRIKFIPEIYRIWNYYTQVQV
jgi:hypothetical protein